MHAVHSAPSNAIDGDAVFYGPSGKLSAAIRRADEAGATLAVEADVGPGCIGLLVHAGIKVSATVRQARDGLLEIAFETPLHGWRADRFLGRSVERAILIRERCQPERLAA